jgi:hypothetical protein
MNTQEINVEDIKNEMNEFYGITVSDEVVNDWLDMYCDDEEDDEFVFDTSEREDFYLYLEEEDLLD